MNRAPHRRPMRRRARGQAMVEYLIIFPTMILLIMGAVQFGLLYQIKSQVNYATFNAARQGALKQASGNSMKDAFAAGMTPLFTPDDTYSKLMRGRAVAAIEAFNPFVTKLEIINPTADTAKAFGTLDGSYYVIPNDNLMYRKAEAKGSASLTIQDANLLKIRVTYCAKLIVPLASTVIYSVVNGMQGSKALAGEFFSGPRPAPTTSNFCTNLKDKYNEKLEEFTSLTKDKVGIDASDFSTITTVINTISGFLDNTPVPVINWTIGGLRIPVTSEAVVRAQSELRIKQP